MNLNPLTAISPVDGRYNSKTEELSKYFSEFGLIQYRVMIEIEYFIALCDLPLPQLKNFNKKDYSVLRDIYKNWPACSSTFFHYLDHFLDRMVLE